MLSIRPDREKDAVKGQEVPVSARIKATSAKFLGNFSLSRFLCPETMARLREDTAECLRHLETRDGNRLARESCRVSRWFTASLAPSTRHESTTGRGEKDKFHRSAKMGRRWWMYIPKLLSSLFAFQRSFFRKKRGKKRKIPRPCTLFGSRLWIFVLSLAFLGFITTYSRLVEVVWYRALSFIPSLRSSLDLRNLSLLTEWLVSTHNDHFSSLFCSR